MQKIEISINKDNPTTKAEFILFLLTVGFLDYSTMSNENEYIKREFSMNCNFTEDELKNFKVDVNSEIEKYDQIINHLNLIKQDLKNNF